MTFYYSIKQMLRSPLKSFLFFLLTGVTAFLLALGGNLWNMSRMAIQEFERIFTTIGTVEQTANNVKIDRWWDAGENGYQYFKRNYYGEWIPESALEFEGAEYILEPRQRPYFGAYMEEMNSHFSSKWLITVEAVPLETEVLDHSVRMQVTKVLEGSINEGDMIYVCEHHNPEPGVVEAGKTYIMHLNQYVSAHGPEIEAEGSGEPVLEYIPVHGIASTQYTLEGEQIEDAWMDGKGYEEVTENFYETEQGKRWLLLARSQELFNHTIPVQPTDGTKLLMPFYRGEVVITEGRDITKEEYESGKTVCLIPNDLAGKLGKSVGDELELSLYYANYRNTPSDNFPKNGGGSFSFSFINADGELYPVFHEQKYEIVGIYMVEDYGSGSYGIGQDEVVIPWNAVPENSWKDNILAYSPMRGATTAFQIPNGSIEKYQELWQQQEIEDLEITFYDKGYTQLKDGIENRNRMSWIFLFSGSALAVMILLFFSNLFITGQQERIAVERLLGRTKKQCAASILTGMLVLAAAGSIFGSMAGWMATETVEKKADAEVVFDTTFSDSVIENMGETDVEWTKPSIVLSIGTGCGLVLAAFAISACYMKENLKKEPLQLLGKIEE